MGCLLNAGSNSGYNGRIKMYNLGEEKLIIYCDYHYVECIILKEYGFKEFSIPCNEEMGNDVIYEANVDGKVNVRERKDIDDRRQLYRTRIYLNDLAKRGLIKKGVYMIRISW